MKRVRFSYNKITDYYTDVNVDLAICSVSVLVRYYEL